MNEMIISIIPAAVTAAVFFILIVVLLAKGKKNLAFKVVLALMELAETIFGAGAGNQKHQYVVALVERVYWKLPNVLRSFISLDELDDYIITLHLKFKEYIEAQTNL